MLLAEMWCGDRIVTPLYQYNITSAAAAAAAAALAGGGDGE